MDDISVFTMDSTQPVIPDLRKELPRIAGLIGETLDSVNVYDSRRWRDTYQTTDWRDRCILKDGVINGLPMIQQRRQQTDGYVGLGLTVYENRLDPRIKYAYWRARGSQADETYIVVGKANAFRLLRNIIRQNREASKITKVPVLEPGLLDEIVRNTVGFLLRAKEIENYGIRIKRGLIFDGPPGNGKTMLCRYIQKLCAQHNISWSVVTSSEIDDAYEHKYLDDLFRNATVTFFDDIDVAYMDRKKGNGKMACALLTAMDGMADEGHIVRIFTTNEQVSELDEAFTRPGRIDKCITFEKPSEDLRRKLVVEFWPEEVKAAVDVDGLIRRSKDFSFAELECIRTLLVTNKLLGTERWDLELAFDEFRATRDAKKRKVAKVGFGP